MNANSSPLHPSFEIPADLKRYPIRPRELLQAWESADHLLLKHLQTLQLSKEKIVVFGDAFGALAFGLHGLDYESYTDSYISYKSTETNSGGRLQPKSRFNDLAGPFDLAVIKIPKSMSFFEDELCHLSQILKPGGKLICGYQVKHQANSAFELIERIIGKTHTSLAEKKARLIFAEFTQKPVQSPYPKEVAMDGFHRHFIHHSGVFSRERLDIGTRFLLDHLPDGDFQTILDLGCGNGIVGIKAKQLHSQAKLIFTDESQMAIDSARANYKNYFIDEAEFHWTHAFENGLPKTVDLVLCNPPFHQGNTQGDFVAWQMFKDAHRVLRPGGLLRVIGNQHLRHANALKRIFGRSEIIAKNAKFEICDSFK